MPEAHREVKYARLCFQYRSRSLSALFLFPFQRYTFPLSSLYCKDTLFTPFLPSPPFLPKTQPFPFHPLSKANPSFSNFPFPKTLLSPLFKDILSKIPLTAIPIPKTPHSNSCQLNKYSSILFDQKHNYLRLVLYGQQSTNIFFCQYNFISQRRIIVLPYSTKNDDPLLGKSISKYH